MKYAYNYFYDMLWLVINSNRLLAYDDIDKEIIRHKSLPRIQSDIKVDCILWDLFSIITCVLLMFQYF